MTISDHTNIVNTQWTFANTDESKLLSVKQLFKLWKALEEDLVKLRCRDHAECDYAIDDKDGIIDAQSAILNLVGQLSSQDFEDVMYKLAIWRWDVGSNIESLSDGVLLSAYSDMLRLIKSDNNSSEGECSELPVWG